jgi:microsomal dipeptidase-like Zn-dependent dipeptidase
MLSFMLRLRGAFLTSALLLGSGPVSSQTPDDAALRAKAERIHAKILPFDLHLDIGTDFDSDAAPASADGTTQFDLPKAKRGGLKAASLAVFTPQTARTPENLAKAREEAAAKHRIITGLAQRYPDKVGLAKSPADVRAIAASGRLAVVETILNAYPIGTDLALLDDWIDKGVRAVGFTHAGHNDLADSSRPSKPRGEGLSEHDGLSSVGKAAVARLNDRGVVIDVSQLSDKAFADVLALTRAPVVATHSDIRSLHEATRNLSDAQLDALKRNGGVIGIVAFAPYLGQSASGGKASVAELVKALTYAVKRIGIDHVAIASDFNHGGGVVGWENEGEAGNVTLELVRQGYTEAQIRKLWGENYLRVWQRVIDLRRR